MRLLVKDLRDGSQRSIELAALTAVLVGAGADQSVVLDGFGVLPEHLRLDRVGHHTLLTVRPGALVFVDGMPIETERSIIVDTRDFVVGDFALSVVD